MNTFINIFLIILVFINIYFFIYVINSRNDKYDKDKCDKDNTDMYTYSKPATNLLSLLPPIYVINLEDRVDRLIQFKKEMIKIMYPLEKIFRIDAIKDKENGHKGCLQSHVKALKIALQKNDPYVFIAEDDIYFLHDSLTTINCIIGEMSTPDWNVLLLDCRGVSESGSLTKEKLKRGVGGGRRKHGCEGTTGYIIRKTYIPTLLSIWEPTIGINNWKNSEHACDQSWKVLQDHKWIIVAPKLITARLSFSSIENKEMKHYNNNKNWKRGPDNIPIELKSSQRKMSSMLKIFNNISKRYDFKYWSIGSTLLGIIRNNNWVDLDLGIDLSMLKSDYFKFRDIIIKELPEHLWLQDFISDKNYKEESVVKIKDLNSCYTEYSEKHKDSHNGLQIDIFLCDIENNILKKGLDKIFIPSQKIEDVFPLKMGKFGNLNIPIPNNSHKILTENYGDYMKLPLSKRYPEETSTYKTCEHHLTKYPQLYLKMKGQ